jgi:DNA-binding PadR family transcriptional regulator
LFASWPNRSGRHPSRLLAALESQGFLASERGFDRRRRDYRATDMGTALAEDFRSEIVGNACRTILYWPIGKQVEVLRLLERLVKVLNAP